MPGTASLNGRTREASVRFLTALAQTIKVVSLYKIGHPVPTSAVQETWNHLHELFTVTGWDEVALGNEGGRWLVNTAALDDSGGALALLSMVFRSHALTSVTFEGPVRIYELTAFCEMAATPPNRAYETDAGEMLKERGVKHLKVNVEQFVRARRVRPPASAIIESPLAALARKPDEGAPELIADARRDHVDEERARVVPFVALAGGRAAIRAGLATGAGALGIATGRRRRRRRAAASRDQAEQEGE